MSIGKFAAMYGDDALRLAREALGKQATKGCKPLATSGTMGSLFTRLQGVSGKASITLEGDVLQRALANMEGSTQTQKDIFEILKQIVAKCKKPSVTIGAKASKQGFNVAGISLRDGEKLVASGAASVTTKATKAGVKPQVYKMRLNTTDGMVNARSHLDITQTPKITDHVRLNLGSENLVATADYRYGDVAAAQAKLDLNKLAGYFPTKEINTIKRELNQKIAKGFQEALKKSPLG